MSHPSATTRLGITRQARENSASKPAKAAIKIGKLPRWNLGDLYSGPKSQALARDLTRAEGRAARFEKTYKGKLARMSGKRLGAAVSEYEVIDESLGKVMSYAQLLYAADVASPRVAQFYQTLVERVNGISTGLLFFTLELNRMPERILRQKLRAPELAH